MKKRMVAILLILIGLVATACGVTENTQTQAASKNTTVIQANITPEDAKKRLESEEGIILLDVRTKEEYIEKHIPNSLLIPVDMIEKEASSKLTDKNATIVIYCRSGRRSAIAAEYLVKMGYSKVYDLGGINDWPYETESGNETHP